MQMKIAPMTLEDLDEVLEIEVQAFTTPWSRNSFLYELLENERAIYLTAKNEFDRVMGYVGMWVVFDEGHITNLAIHPQFRRCGVARRLMLELIAVAKGKEVRYLTLEVRRTNSAAQELYQKLGFVHMGVRRKYYLDNNEDALIMWKGPL
ncbi:MAG: ribosomal protein S18-alanine N-acetyltransferase [Firmicutes bacterium]|nr:ribosomal protein S18-alanine N-acetyltransferase [Bacillota bacterium]